MLLAIRGERSIMPAGIYFRPKGHWFAEDPYVHAGRFQMSRRGKTERTGAKYRNCGHEDSPPG